MRRCFAGFCASNEKRYLIISSLFQQERDTIIYDQIEEAEMLYISDHCSIISFYVFGKLNTLRREL